MTSGKPAQLSEDFSRTLSPSLSSLQGASELDSSSPALRLQRSSQIAWDEFIKVTELKEECDEEDKEERNNFDMKMLILMLIQKLEESKEMQIQQQKVITKMKGEINTLWAHYTDLNAKYEACLEHNKIMAYELKRIENMKLRRTKPDTSEVDSIQDFSVSSSASGWTNISQSEGSEESQFRQVDPEKKKAIRAQEIHLRKQRMDQIFLGKINSINYYNPKYLVQTTSNVSDEATLPTIRPKKYNGKEQRASKCAPINNITQNIVLDKTKLNESFASLRISSGEIDRVLRKPPSSKKYS